MRLLLDPYCMNFSESLDRLESMLPHADKKAESVSKKSIGWHLHHLCLTNLAVMHSLKNSDPATYADEPNEVRENVFRRGTIMRGYVKAPDPVNPEDVNQNERILALIAKQRAFFSQYDLLPDLAYFRHPFMGPLHKKKSLEFMVIHNHHHLSIADDILAEA